jgi:hypothetical protein
MTAHHQPCSSEKPLFALDSQSFAWQNPHSSLLRMSPPQPYFCVSSTNSIKPIKRYIWCLQLSGGGDLAASLKKLGLIKGLKNVVTYLVKEKVIVEHRLKQSSIVGMPGQLLVLPSLLVPT